MRRLNKILLLITIIVSITMCSDSATESEPENNNNYQDALMSLFPLKIGNSYTYKVDTLNKSNNSFENIGVRYMDVENNILEDHYQSFICSQNYILKNSSKQNISNIRFTDNSIEYFIDSTGASSFASDSIDFEVTISMDETAKMVHYPYGEYEEWVVFKAFAHFAGTKFNVFSITGRYEGTETLDIPELNSSITTEKFIYNGELNIPDINNPFIKNLKTYEAHIWLSPEYGIVKLEGFAMFISPLTGSRFNIADSNKVFRHTLVEAK